MSDVDVTVCSKCIVESSSPDRSESGLEADSYVESCADWRKQTAAKQAGANTSRRSRWCAPLPARCVLPAPAVTQELTLRTMSAHTPSDLSDCRAARPPSRPGVSTHRIDGSDPSEGMPQGAFNGTRDGGPLDIGGE